MQNTAIIASFTTQKNFQIDQLLHGKRHAKVEICNNEQNSPLCIELKSAIVEICNRGKKYDQNAPWCNEKLMF